MEISASSWMLSAAVEMPKEAEKGAEIVPRVLMHKSHLYVPV